PTTTPNHVELIFKFSNFHIRPLLPSPPLLRTITSAFSPPSAVKLHCGAAAIIPTTKTPSREEVIFKFSNFQIRPLLNPRVPPRIITSALSPPSAVKLHCAAAAIIHTTKTPSREEDIS